MLLRLAGSCLPMHRMAPSRSRVEGGTSSPRRTLRPHILLTSSFLPVLYQFRMSFLMTMSAPMNSLRPRQTMPRRLSRTQRQLRGLVLLGTLLSTLLMVFYQRVPNVFGLGLLVDNAAPWFGISIPLLLLLALFSRSRSALAFVLIPTMAWVMSFGSAIIPLSWTAPAKTTQSISVGSQNVRAGTGGAVASAQDLSAQGSDVIALQELESGSANRVTQALQRSYPHHFVVGTVGVWSKYPLSNSQSLDLGLGWKRALRTEVTTDTGTVRLYVVHAASARASDHSNRDEMLAQLASTLRQDQSPRVIALGDFNATSTDRSFTPLTETMDEPNQDQGMFGFTWPRKPFGFMRLDHVLQRGLEVSSNTVVPAGESDHLAVLTSLNFPSSDS